MIDPDKLPRGVANPFDSWHHEITWNTPTCYIDYNEKDFIVHVRHPLGKYPRDYVWYYPCVFNNKPLKLVPADMARMGYNHYGSWGIHYI